MVFSLETVICLIESSICV